MNLPNLLCVGSGRCGTTHLYGLLSQSPDISVSPAKEVNFFGIKQYPFSNPGLSLQDYAAEFSEPTKSTKYTVDLTPVYIASNAALRSAKNILADVKVIITLREPIDRAFSHYKYHSRQHGYASADEYFREALSSYCGEKLTPQWYAPEKALRMSSYYAGVSTCLELFNRSNCLILFYDDLVKDPTTWTSAVNKFLDLDLQNVDDENGAKFKNESSSRSFESGLSAPTKSHLMSFFSRDIARTSVALGEDLFKRWYGV